jgi:hypothetical protein
MMMWEKHPFENWLIEFLADVLRILSSLQGSMEKLVLPSLKICQLCNSNCMWKNSPLIAALILFSA